MAKRTIEQQLADIDKKRDELLARKDGQKQTEIEKTEEQLVTARARAATANTKVSDLESKLASLKGADVPVDPES